jgi:hypothetical protein
LEHTVYFIDDLLQLLRVLFVDRLFAQFVPVLCFSLKQGSPLRAEFNGAASVSFGVKERAGPLTVSDSLYPFSRPEDGLFVRSGSTISQNLVRT